jgi:hypothetical protein
VAGAEAEGIWVVGLLQQQQPQQQQPQQQQQPGGFCESSKVGGDTSSTAGSARYSSCNMPACTVALLAGG